MSNESIVDCRASSMSFMELNVEINGELSLARVVRMMPSLIHNSSNTVHISHMGPFIKDEFRSIMAGPIVEVAARPSPQPYSLLIR
jgi:hypothetical protein